MLGLRLQLAQVLAKTRGEVEQIFGQCVVEIQLCGLMRQLCSLGISSSEATWQTKSSVTKQ